MKATLHYSLPDDQGEFDAALVGRDALTVLADIDQHLRSLLKHGTPTPEAATLAETVREMIPGELLDK